MADPGVFLSITRCRSPNRCQTNPASGADSSAVRAELLTKSQMFEKKTLMRSKETKQCSEAESEETIQGGERRNRSVSSDTPNNAESKRQMNRGRFRVMPGRFYSPGCRVCRARLWRSGYGDLNTYALGFEGRPFPTRFSRTTTSEAVLGGE